MPPQLSLSVKKESFQVTFPVWTPATTETFATYGEIDGDDVVVQPMAAPDGMRSTDESTCSSLSPDVYPGYGGIEIMQMSTALQALTDAMIYLYHYPFECSYSCLCLSRFDSRC